MIGFIAPYTSTTRDYRQYSAIADLHTSQFTVVHVLGFSVFTSRILATDLQQSHYHFKSHTKSFSHSLVPFLPLFCNLLIPKTRLNSIPLLPSSYPGRLASRNSTRLDYYCSVLLYVKFKVTLRLTVSQPICLGVKPHLGLMTRHSFLF
jgi:hypothetical protein